MEENFLSIVAKSNLFATLFRDKSFQGVGCRKIVSQNDAMKYGYARISTADQNAALQQDALTSASCDKIITEKISGAASKRPKLEKLLQTLQAGDVLTVWRLDRLGRSIDHLRGVVKMLDQKGVGFQSLNETIDTTTANGELIFNLFASLADFERSLLVERTKAGLVAAKKRGARLGRPPSKQSGSLMTGSGSTIPSALTRLSTSERQIRHTSAKRKHEKRHEHKSDTP